MFFVLITSLLSAGAERESFIINYNYSENNKHISLHNITLLLNFSCTRFIYIIIPLSVKFTRNKDPEN